MISVVSQSRRWVAAVGIAAFALFSTSACRRQGAISPGGSTSIQSDPSPAPWATGDPATWPQIVLTNQAEFHGSSPLQGASAFLIKAPEGRILGATARHLLGVNGGVEPTIKPEDLNNALTSWYLFPRTKPDSVALVTGLGAPSSQEKRYDWLILELEHSHGELPAMPLELRSSPVTIGEEVYLVGVPYSDTHHSQNIYRGKVATRDDANRRFTYTLDPPVDVRGFSGAPVVDRQGRVLGVFTVWFDPKSIGDLNVEGGAEAPSAVLEVLKTR